MIVDLLENSDLYGGMSERILAAFKYLHACDLSELKPGRYDIRGNEIFAMVSDYTTKPREQCRWEAHQRYIDIQYLIHGEELIGVTNPHCLKLTEAYDAQSDVMFYEGEGGDFIRLCNDKFVLLFPHDAHMPSIATATPSTVKKIVIKILL